MAVTASDILVDAYRSEIIEATVGAVRGLV